MTTVDDEFTTVEEVAGGGYFKPEEYLNQLLIVRPRKYQESGFVTEFKPEGTDAVFVNVAVVEALNEDGTVGRVFRNSSLLQGYLKGTFKRYIGSTLVGAIILGPREKGRKPPYQWLDLSGDAEARQKAGVWLKNNPTFKEDEVFASVSNVAAAASQPAVPDMIARAQAAAAAAAAKPAEAVGAPAAGLSTLEQLKAMNAGVNHHGDPQPIEAPF